MENKAEVRPSIYMAITLIAFIINPAFGVIAVLFCVADIIFDFLKLK